MDMKQAKVMHGRFIAAMRDHGSKERGIVDFDWLIGHLLDRMDDLGIDDVNPKTLRAAALHYMGTDVMDRATTKTQATIKTAVSSFWAYCVNGKIILKTTLYPKGVPDEFKLVFIDFCDFLGTQTMANRTAQMYKCVAKIAFCYFRGRGITDLHDVGIDDMREFVRSHFLPKKNGIKETARIAMLIDWLNAAGHIGFSSADAFPYGYGRSVGGKRIPSYYTVDELQRIFSVVDRSTATGKRDYLVLCLLAIYGMRIGDVIDLRIGDIDWEAGTITKIQHKTGNPLCLPIVDEVKDALLDYIDGARPETVDDHLVIRAIPPYAGYTCTSSFTKIVTKYMHEACVDPSGRHHGCHALRHSMAGGMIADGATIEQISNVLGHSSTESTKTYLSFDAKAMKKLGLEVPHGTI